MSGLASFLPVPVNGRKVSRHGKADYVLVPVVGTEFTGHGAFYKRRAKNKAPARRPAALLTLSREQDQSWRNKVL